MTDQRHGRSRQSPWRTIPCTRSQGLNRTTPGTKQPGELVNLEVDVIAKYVEKLIGGAR
jgi:riboflavin synthase alpha subunit